MRKKIIFIVCLCIFVIAFIIIILSSKQDLKAIVIEKDYSLTSTVDTIDQINVPILLNQKSSYFSDVNQIDKMTLSNLQEDDMMQAKIINISFSDEKIKIEDDNYYMAIYTCEIEFFPTEEMKWYFPEIYLNILYKNNVQAKLKIGEMTYNKVNSFNQEHLSLSTIRGTTSMINNNNMLDGMFLGFRNQTNNDITINILVMKLIK